MISLSNNTTRNIMANNYTQFSTLLPLPTSEDAIQRVKDWYDAVLEEQSSNEDMDYDEDPYFGFQFTLDDGQIWIYGAECGDVEKAADFVQKYLNDLDITGGIGITWANTCSRMRVNEFDGGAVVVTKTDMMWQSPYDLFKEAGEAGVEILNF